MQNCNCRKERTSGWEDHSQVIINPVMSQMCHVCFLFMCTHVLPKCVPGNRFTNVSHISNTSTCFLRCCAHSIFKVILLAQSSIQHFPLNIPFSRCQSHQPEQTSPPPFSSSAASSVNMMLDMRRIESLMERSSLNSGDR